MKVVSWLLLCASLLVFAQAFAQPPSAAKIAQGDLASLMDQAARAKGLQLLVTLDFPQVQEFGGAAAGTRRQAIASAQTNFAADLAGVNAQVVIAYTAFPIALVQMDSQALQHIIALPEVRYIQPNGLNRTADNGTNAVMHTSAVWSAGYDGTGWTIVVLDTGMQTTHPFLGGRVVAEACFSGGSGASGYSSLCPNGQGFQAGAGAGANCPYTGIGCEHGTAIAGIAAGHGTYGGGVGYDGAARGANLASIQVFSFDNNASALAAFDSNVLSALQFVHDSLVSNVNLKIAAVNLSLTSAVTSTTPCDTSAYKPAIDTLRADGVATVIATGNAGVLGISAPACVSTAISTGATDNSDNVTAYSNNANFMSLWAPGDNVGSSVPGSSYATYSGTSMAAAQVSGAWAITKQKLPTASVSSVLNVLQVTGKPIVVNGFTKARIDFDVIFANGFQ